MYKILEECPLFRGLSSDDISALFSNEEYTHKEFVGGDIISSKDSEYSSLMIVLKGSVTGTYSSSKGEVMTMDEISAPNLISPAFLFGGYNKLPVDVVAASDYVDVLIIHRAKLFELMQESAVILSNFIDVLSNRAGNLNKKLFYLSFASLRAKICEYLIDQEGSHSAATTKKIVKYFDISLDSVERIIESLVKEGCVKLEGSDITIIDIELLKQH